MSLVCHKVSLIVAIYKYYSSKTVLCTFMPISFVKSITFRRNAISKAISLPSCFAPLAFIPITVRHLSDCFKFAIMELRERNRTVVEWWQTFMKLLYRVFDWIFRVLEIHRHVYDRFSRLQYISCTQWIAIVQELLKRFYFVLVYFYLLLELFDQFDQLCSLFV